MKKIVSSIVLAVVLGFSSLVFGADGGIAQTEVVPDVAEWKIKSVYLDAELKLGKIVYRKVDADGNTVSKLPTIFKNIPSEGLTKFTQLINLINSNNNIKESAATAVKTELGLP